MTADVNHRTASDPGKETNRMSKRLATIAIPLVVTVALLAALPAAAAASPSPWWHLTAGAQPTNMWLPQEKQEVQQITSSDAALGVMLATIEVEGKVVGCLGGSSSPGTAGFYCEYVTGLPGTETAQQLEALLETVYGAGKVQVSGGPAGEAAKPLRVSTEWGVPTLTVKVAEVVAGEPIGSASSEIASLGSGRLVLTAVNLGDASVTASRSNPVVFSDSLPGGIEAYAVQGYANLEGFFLTPIPCKLESPRSVSCEFSGTLPAYHAIEVQVFANVSSTTPGAPGRFAVSGGGAPGASTQQQVKISQAEAPFGFQSVSTELEAEGGGPVRQAGAHPFQFTTSFEVNRGPFIRRPNGELIESAPHLLRNASFELPPGLVANTTAVEQCSLAQFLGQAEKGESCHPAAAVGVAIIDYRMGDTGTETRATLPIDNLTPGYGEPARFGFFAATVPIFINTSVETEHGYRIVATSRNTTELDEVHSVTVVIWGDPGDPSHDESRGKCVLAEEACTRPPGLRDTAYMRVPDSCSEPLGFLAKAEPWNVPLGSDVFEEGLENQTLLGCNRVPFDPHIASAPTSKLAESPTGLGFTLSMPNAGLENASEQAIAESQPKKVEVTLPEGMTVNPSAAAGIAVCTQADYKHETLESKPGEGCPEASKIGNVEVETPLLTEKATGALYLAAPHENPFDSLLAVYLVARIPDRGILVKQAGEIKPDPVTGRLVTTFDNVPQVPFSVFKLEFREGARAPLVTPAACGTYTTLAKFLPWSAESLTSPAPSEITTRTSSFAIEHGIGGGACPSGGTPPFKPTVVAGTNNNAAGSYSPFYLRIERKDGEQEITGFSTQLPPGLTGDLTGVQQCPEADVQHAREQSGTEAEANPACPAGSEIGHTIAEAGIGSVLAQTPGKLYLGGPFEGAPFSVVSVTSAKVGPFDLGTVVVHLPLDINPVTAAVSIPSGPADQIPHIIEGIVIHVRDIRVYVNRTDFILNPTNCAAQTLSATVIGGGANFADPADADPVTVANRFQAANCANLAFKPIFKVSTSGKTSRANGASLTAKLTYPNAPVGTQANIRSVKVDLPKQLPSRLTTLQKACTAAQFNTNPAGCPAASVVGHATAITPLIPVPLVGPAYFVSHGGEAFPSLIVVLQGYGVTIDLVGTTFISKAGITSSTFKTVPDQPIGSFELTLPEGKFSALAANGNLCKSKLAMPTAFVAQNGAVIKQSTPIGVTGCKPTLTIVRHSVSGNTATVTVGVPSAGKLVASGNGLSGAAKSTGKAATVTLALTLSKQDRLLLAQHPGRKLKLSVKLLFTPKHGSRLSSSVTVLMG
jgi:hypothetical protein